MNIVNINAYQTKCGWISDEYSSSNTNGDMLLQDEPLSCLMNSVHWIDGGKYRVYRDVDTHWSFCKGFYFFATKDSRIS